VAEDYVAESFLVPCGEFIYRALCSVRVDTITLHWHSFLVSIITTSNDSYKCSTTKFETLLPICSNDTAQFSLLVVGVSASIIGRYFVMQKQIKRVTDVPLWDSNIPFDKREALFTAVTYSKPSNINNFDGLCVRYVTMPSKIMGLVGAMIVNILHNKLSDEDEKSRILIVLAMLIVGGIGINGTRHGSFGMDWFFRVVFSAGFVGLMYFLGKVSDMTLVESIN
jgi:hypothetical protein